MNAYLVRLHKSMELVGLFVSPSENVLWEFVDECCDPDECEFVQLPAGGIYLPKAGGPRVPTCVEYPDDDRDIPDWFADAIASELWIDIFYSEEHGPKWQPVSLSKRA